MKEENEALKVVSELNMDSMLEINEHQMLFFKVKYDGLTCIVTFLGERIWDSDNEERDWRESTCSYKPLKPFLLKQAEKVLKDLNNRFELIKEGVNDE